MVAPSFFARSRRAAIGSTQMIVDAPMMRAPWTALRPTGPAPITTTLSPKATGTNVVTAPRPVAPTQPSTASSAPDAFVSAGTQYQS